MADNPQSPVERWLSVTKAYENEFKAWTALSTKTVERYRDKPRATQNQDITRFNILWSNVQTLKPAVYAKLPKADVSRRFDDNDPVHLADCREAVRDDDGSDGLEELME